MSNVDFRPRRAVPPDDIDHVEVWRGISRETNRPIYGVDYVFGDGGHAGMSTSTLWSEAMRAARECADGIYPIRQVLA